MPLEKRAGRGGRRSGSDEARGAKAPSAKRDARSAQREAQGAPPTPMPTQTHGRTRTLRPVVTQNETHDRDLARQLGRAASSIALNVAVSVATKFEGRGIEKIEGPKVVPPVQNGSSLSSRELAVGGDGEQLVGEIHEHAVVAGGESATLTLRYTGEMSFLTVLDS